MAENTEIPNLPGLAELISLGRGEVALTDEQVLASVMRLRTDAMVVHNERFEASLQAFIAETTANHAKQLERAFAEGANKQAAVSGTSVDDELLQMSPYRIIEVSFDVTDENEG